jgi:hypothetical protein
MISARPITAEIGSELLIPLPQQIKSGTTRNVRMPKLSRAPEARLHFVENKHDAAVPHYRLCGERIPPARSPADALVAFHHHARDVSGFNPRCSIVLRNVSKPCPSAIAVGERNTGWRDLR